MFYNSCTVSNTSAEQVTYVLNEIVRKIQFDNGSEKINLQKNDLFFILILVLMMENGFLPIKNEFETLDSTLSIDLDQLSRWKTLDGNYEVLLIIPLFETMPLKLIISPLGETVLVNIVIKGLESETYSVCFALNQYVVSHEIVEASIFQNLSDISFTFRNKVLSIVRSRIQSSCGYPSGSIIGLPEEIIHKIILYLPLKDAISLHSTCKKLKSIVDSDSLWHLLYKRDFNTQMLNDIDWKELYKNEYIAQNKSRQTLRGSGTMHDYMDYSDYVSYIENPMWDVII